MGCRRRPEQKKKNSLRAHPSAITVGSRSKARAHRLPDPAKARKRDADQGEHRRLRHRRCTEIDHIVTVARSMPAEGLPKTEWGVVFRTELAVEWRRREDGTLAAVRV